MEFDNPVLDNPNPKLKDQIKQLVAQGRIKPNTPYIYAWQDFRTSLIKIGYTKNPLRRLGGYDYYLNPGYYDPAIGILIFLHKGLKRTEWCYHNLWTPAHAKTGYNREWYLPNKAMIEFLTEKNLKRSGPLLATPLTLDQIAEKYPSTLRMGFFTRAVQAPRPGSTQR